MHLVHLLLTCVLPQERNGRYAATWHYRSQDDFAGPASALVPPNASPLQSSKSSTRSHRVIRNCVAQIEGDTDESSLTGLLLGIFRTGSARSAAATRPR